MEKAFSVVSWNVKHFKKKPNEQADAARANRVVSLLKQQDPDVFALYACMHAFALSFLTEFSAKRVLRKLHAIAGQIFQEAKAPTTTTT